MLHDKDVETPGNTHAINLVGSEPLLGLGASSLILV